MKPSEKFVRRYVEPHHDTIKSIVAAAVQHWKAIPAEQRGILLLRKRTFANCMWQFLVHEAGLQFAGSNIVVTEKRGTVTFTVGGNVLMRFKKICPKGRSSNYQTRRAIAFNLQSLLPDLPDAVRVDIGYVLDELGQNIEDVRIVQREGNAIAWSYSVTKGAVEEQERDLFDALENESAAPAEKSRVRVVAPKRKEQEDGNAA